MNIIKKVIKMRGELHRPKVYDSEPFDCFPQENIPFEKNDTALWAWR